MNEMKQEHWEEVCKQALSFTIGYSAYQLDICKEIEKSVFSWFRLKEWGEEIVRGKAALRKADTLKNLLYYKD